MNLLDSAASGCGGCKDLLRMLVNVWIDKPGLSRIIGDTCPNGHEFSEDDLKEALRKLG